MRKYYILNCKINNDSYFAEKGKISNQEIISRTFNGESLLNEDVNIQLCSGKGELLHFIENVFSLPIFSEKIIVKLKELCSNELEFFPVRVDKKLGLKYYFINILQNIDAIDYTNSEYTELAPNTGILILKDIDKLIIKDLKVSNRHIFRLIGFNVEIIISSKLKKELDQLNIDELKYIPIEEYTRSYSKPNWNRYL